MISVKNLFRTGKIKYFIGKKRIRKSNLSLSEVITIQDLFHISDKRRIGQHKTFKEIAQRGQFSLGWFFGFKLHIITNDSGGIINFMLTPANVHDTNPLKMKGFISKLYGKLFGDKGYLSKELFQSLFANGIHTLLPN